MIRKYSIAFLLLCSAALQAADKKPNILFIFSDDHSHKTIGAYGSKLNQTPNIDRIADKGIVFDNSFCANSICQPSRACVLTGKHSHKNGLLYNGSKWDGTQKTLPRLLGDAGYKTALIGKWHMHPNPSDDNFDYWTVLSGHGGQGSYYNPHFAEKGKDEIQHFHGFTTDIIADKSISWLKENSDGDQPFLLMMQFKAPHVPRQPHPRYANLYKDQDIPEPATLHDDYSTREPYASKAWMKLATGKDEALNIYPKKLPEIHEKHPLFPMDDQQRKDFLAVYEKENTEYYKLKAEGAFKDQPFATSYRYQRFIKDYLRCVAGIDDNVGRVLDWLKDNNLEENTIVVYSSDQSYYIGEHGWAEKRWMYEESLRMPFIISWPVKFKSASHLPQMIQNIDYAPTFLEAAGVQIPKEIQGKSLIPMMIRGNEAKEVRDSIYYHYYHHGAHNVPRHDGVRTERYKLIHFYTDDKYELYDLKQDPNEVKNLYNNPEYTEIREKMQLELNSQRSNYEVPQDTFQAPFAYQARKPAPKKKKPARKNKK
jgi:arylsulfatase A-like enzyme